MFNSSFENLPQWKEKYEISWCGLCNVAIIKCPQCDSTSCNTGGCEACDSDFTEFLLQGKISVEAYLSKEEAQIYDKARRIQKFILETLAEGRSKIDWKALKDQGKMSQNDQEHFAKELKT